MNPIQSTSTHSNSKPRKHLEGKNKSKSASTPLTKAKKKKGQVFQEDHGKELETRHAQKLPKSRTRPTKEAAENKANELLKDAIWAMNDQELASAKQSAAILLNQGNLPDKLKNKIKIFQARLIVFEKIKFTKSVQSSTKAFDKIQKEAVSYEQAIKLLKNTNGEATSQTRDRLASIDKATIEQAQGELKTADDVFLQRFLLIYNKRNKQQQISMPQSKSPLNVAKQKRKRNDSGEGGKKLETRHAQELPKSRTRPTKEAKTAENKANELLKESIWLMNTDKRASEMKFIENFLKEPNHDKKLKKKIKIFQARLIVFEAIGDDLEKQSFTEISEKIKKKEYPTINKKIIEQAQGKFETSDDDILGLVLNN